MGGPHPRHEFLSPEWIEAVIEIRASFADRVREPSVAFRANVVVTGVPFGDGEVRGFVDTHRGLVIEPGHLEEPDFTAELDYETASSLLVDQDPRAVLQAVFGGRVRLSGDASKLLELTVDAPLEGSEEEAAARELADLIRSVTR